MTPSPPEARPPTEFNPPRDMTPQEQAAYLLGQESMRDELAQAQVELRELQEMVVSADVLMKESAGTIDVLESRLRELQEALSVFVRIKPEAVMQGEWFQGEIAKAQESLAVSPEKNQ